MGDIVVGVDGSNAALNALRWAATEARARDSRLVAISAFSYEEPAIARPWAVETSPTYRQVERGVREILEDAVTEAVPQTVTAERRVVELAPADALLGAARDAELVVVGSRGLGGFRGLLLGSVSRQVVTRSPVPAAVVAGPPQPLTRRIVVGTDGSQPAARALRWAAAAAQRRDATLVVIHADPEARVSVSGVPVPTEDDDAVAARAREVAQRVVDEVLGDDVGTDIEVRGTGGHPARRLLDAAENADALVVGSRGRGQITGMLLGSTSAACVGRSTCPTVVVPASQDDEGEVLSEVPASSTVGPVSTRDEHHGPTAPRSTDVPSR